MAKNDRDLFNRLRQAGLRKQVARTLSELGDGASKKAVRAAQSTVSELRSLAGEIERRLPGTTSEQTSPAPASPARGRTRSATAPRQAPRPRPAGGTARAARSPSAPGAARSSSGAGAAHASSGARRARASAAASPAGTSGASTRARAPRGENKAKILETLKAGPKSATEVARETGIGTGTVSTTLNKMARTGEVAKAERGYRLPG